MLCSELFRDQTPPAVPLRPDSPRGRAQPSLMHGLPLPLAVPPALARHNPDCAPCRPCWRFPSDQGQARAVVECCRGPRRPRRHRRGRWPAFRPVVVMLGHVVKVVSARFLHCVCLIKGVLLR